MKPLVTEIGCERISGFLHTVCDFWAEPGSEGIKCSSSVRNGKIVWLSGTIGELIYEQSFLWGAFVAPSIGTGRAYKMYLARSETTPVPRWRVIVLMNILITPPVSPESKTKVLN